MSSNKVRLIDANNAHDVLMNIGNHLAEAGNIEMASSVYYAAEVIENQTTIDPESLRPHGNWELNEDGKWSCSCCGSLAVEHPNEPEKWQALTTCCPNCGAKMEG